MALLGAQAFKHDPEDLRGQVLPAGASADVAHHPLGGRLGGVGRNGNRR
jgi:hypothetical protein